jgi:hypothetical protein
MNIFENIYNYYTTIQPYIIPPLNYSMFTQINSIFKGPYSECPKKSFFSNAEEYKHIKSILTYKLRIYQANNLLYLTTIYIVLYNVIYRLKYLIDKPFRQLYPTLGLTALFTTTIGFLMYKYTSINISDAITLKSRFGIYLWFEYRYYHHLLNEDNINSLDSFMMNELSIIKNNRLKSEERIGRLIFYLALKKHYYLLLINRKSHVDLNLDLSDKVEKIPIDLNDKDMSDIVNIFDLERLYSINQLENLVKNNLFI